MHRVIERDCVCVCVGVCVCVCVCFGDDWRSVWKGDFGRWRREDEFKDYWGNSAAAPACYRGVLWQKTPLWIIENIMKCPWRDRKTTLWHTPPISLLLPESDDWAGKEKKKKFSPIISSFIFPLEEWLLSLNGPSSLVFIFCLGKAFIWQALLPFAPNPQLISLCIHKAYLFTINPEWFRVVAEGYSAGSGSLQSPKQGLGRERCVQVHTGKTACRIVRLEGQENGRWALSRHIDFSGVNILFTELSLTRGTQAKEQKKHKLRETTQSNQTNGGMASHHRNNPTPYWNSLIHFFTASARTVTQLFDLHSDLNTKRSTLVDSFTSSFTFLRADVQTKDCVLVQTWNMTKETEPNLCLCLHCNPLMCSDVNCSTN